MVKAIETTSEMACELLKMLLLTCGNELVLTEPRFAIIFVRIWDREGRIQQILLEDDLKNLS